MLKDAIRRAIAEAGVDEYARRLGFAWYHGVNTLYKFKGYSGEQREHVLDMLANSKLYFSSADQFNDPYDLSPVIKLGGDPNDPDFVAYLEAEEKKYMREKGVDAAEVEAYRRTPGGDVLKLADEVRDDLRGKLRGATKVFCMTATQDHPLQWAHYAEKHRGVCLHFRSLRDTPLGLARRVKYQREREPVFIPMGTQSSSDITERFVLTKADFWHYENEYRIVAAPEIDWGAKLDGDYLRVDSAELIGITIGMRMPPDDESDLLQQIDQLRPGLPVWKASEDYDQFWMKISPLR